MEIGKFQKIVDQAKKLHPFWFEGERESPIKSNEIIKFENTVGYSLPEKYKFFISNYGCGYFAFTTIYSIRKGEWNILDKVHQIPIFEGKFIPVSDNGCGDYYGYLIVDSKCSDNIYFADHEKGYEIIQTEFFDLLSFINEIGLKP